MSIARLARAGTGTSYATALSNPRKKRKVRGKAKKNPARNRKGRFVKKNPGSSASGLIPGGKKGAKRRISSPKKFYASRVKVRKVKGGKRPLFQVKANPGKPAEFLQAAAFSAGGAAIAIGAGQAISFGLSKIEAFKNMEAGAVKSIAPWLVGAVAGGLGAWKLKNPTAKKVCIKTMEASIVLGVNAVLADKIGDMVDKALPGSKAEAAATGGFYLPGATAGDFLSPSQTAGSLMAPEASQGAWLQRDANGGYANVGQMPPVTRGRF